jgi:hypothetical protein
MTFIFYTLFFLVILGFIIGFVAQNQNYKKKINTVVTQTKDSLQIIQSSVPSLSMDKRLELTDAFLNFIDDKISMEIVNIRRFEIVLGTANKNLDVDNVIKEVSTKVFNSIKVEVFSDTNFILTESYLIEYIQKRTFLLYMAYLKENVASQI